MPECWDRNVRRDQLSRRPVGGEGRQVRVNAVADVRRIGAVIRSPRRLVRCRRAGTVVRTDCGVAVMSLGHQRFPCRAQQCERGGKGEDPAKPKPGLLAHGRQYHHPRAVV